MRLLKIGAVLVLLIAVGMMILINLATDDSAPYNGYTPLTPEEYKVRFDAEENGFHSIQQAMDQMTTPDKSLQAHLETLKTASEATQEARDYVKENQEVIALAEEGLMQDYSMSPPFVANQTMTWLGDIRSLARLYIYDGHIKRIDGNLPGMTEQFLNALLFSESITKDGLLINNLVAVAVGSLAIGELYPQLENLDSATLRRAVEVLDRYRDRRVPFDEIMANEKAYSDEMMRQQQRNPVEKMMAPLTRLGIDRVLKPAFERFRTAYRDGDTRVIGTLLRARVLLYTLEHGAPPVSLEDVMDGSEVPIDPATGNPFQLVDDKIFSPGPRPEMSKNFEATAASVIDGRTVF